MFFWRKKEEGSEAPPRGQERWFFLAPPFSEVMPQYITLLAHARARCLCKLSRKYFAEGVRGRGGPVSEKRYFVLLPGGCWLGMEANKTGFLGRRLGRMIIKDRRKKGMTMIARSARTAKNGEREVEAIKNLPFLRASDRTDIRRPTNLHTRTHTWQKEEAKSVRKGRGEEERDSWQFRSLPGKKKAIVLEFSSSHFHLVSCLLDRPCRITLSGVAASKSTDPPPYVGT